jgi:hypothetical protein
VEDIGVKEAGKILSSYKRVGQELQAQGKKIDDVPDKEVLELLTKKPDPDPDNEEEKPPSVKDVLTSLTQGAKKSSWEVTLTVFATMELAHSPELTAEQIEEKIKSGELMLHLEGTVFKPDPDGQVTVNGKKARSVGSLTDLDPKLNEIVPQVEEEEKGIASPAPVPQ